MVKGFGRQNGCFIEFHILKDLSGALLQMPEASKRAVYDLIADLVPEHSRLLSETTSIFPCLEHISN
jgi:hypothetical protein